MLGRNMLHAVSYDLLASTVASGTGVYNSDWVKVGSVSHGDGLGVEEYGFLVDVTAIGTNVAFTLQEAPDDGSGAADAAQATSTNVTVTVTATGSVAISDYMPTRPWVRLQANRTGAATLSGLYSLTRPRQLPAVHGADVTAAIGAHGELS